MTLKYYYWFWQNILPPRLCDAIINYGLKHQKTTGITGNQGKGRDLRKNPLRPVEIKKLKKARDSDVVWMNDPWIQKEIIPYVHASNKEAGWNFQWDSSETSQFTIYTKGQYYGWHQDSGDEPSLFRGPKGVEKKIRKLSMSISLSGQKEYIGGNLEFDFNRTVKNKPHVCQEINSKGSLVVFPSFVWHRVTPVTKGTRYSLVSWHLGDPFI